MVLPVGTQFVGYVAERIIGQNERFANRLSDVGAENCDVARNLRTLERLVR
jgi:hypothetical protein